jgi:hypothetical protein
MDIFERILAAIGRGLVALLRALVWQPFVAIMSGAAAGLQQLARRLMPWVVATGAGYWMLVYQPQLLQLGLVIAIMIFGFKVMIKGFRK